MMKLQLGRFLFSLLGLSLLTSAVASAGVTVTLSSPGSGASVSSPFTVKASASSGYPITGWHIYLDDKSVWTTGTTQSISASVSSSSGSHKLYVRAWNSAGAYGPSATIWINVSGGTTAAPSTGEPMPPSGAKLIDNIDQQSGWGHCTD